MAAEALPAASHYDTEKLSSNFDEHSSAANDSTVKTKHFQDSPHKTVFENKQAVFEDSNMPSCPHKISSDINFESRNGLPVKKTPPPPPSTPSTVVGDPVGLTVASASLSLLEELFGCESVIENKVIEGLAPSASQQTPSEQVKQLLTQHLLHKAWSQQNAASGSACQDQIDGKNYEDCPNEEPITDLVRESSLSTNFFTSESPRKVKNDDCRKVKNDDCRKVKNDDCLGSEQHCTDSVCCCLCVNMPEAGSLAVDVTSSLTRQICLLRMQLHEASRALQLEREERCDLSASAARYQTEALELRSELQSVRSGRQEAVQQMECLRSQLQQTQHQQHQQLLQETTARQMAETKLAELRAEIERMQQENSAEWNRREHLESEALNLERANKALKIQVQELLERVKEQDNKIVASAGLGNKTAGSESHEEVSSLREQLSESAFCVGQLKKVLSCKSVECEHSGRRADQYEAEVKRLRQRVVKLRQEHAATQDELDAANNTTRRLVRTKEELQDTVETLQLKLNHLQSRIRNYNRNKKLLPDTDEDASC